MTALKALQKTITHWKIMLNWAKKQNPKKSPQPQEMNKETTHTWEASCALCAYYRKKDCKDCLLFLKTKMTCWEIGSPYHNISYSITWEEWCRETKILVDILKEIKDTMK
jgi:hypothetical protein